MTMRACSGGVGALETAEARKRLSSITARTGVRRLLLAHEDHRRIDRVAPEARAVDRETSGQRLVHLQADLQRAFGRRLLQRRARDGDLHEVTVRARFPQLLVLELRVPGEDPPVIGR